MQACSSIPTRQYAVEVRDLFMDPLEMYANDRLARALREALAEGILTEDDLFHQDEDVLRRLRAARNPDIARDLAGLHPAVQVVEDDREFDIHAYPKARIVDPLVLTADGATVRCSVLEPSVTALHDEVRWRAKKGVFVKFVSAGG